MESYIKALPKEIHNLAEDFVKNFNVTPRFSFVGFKDKKDGNYPISLDFGEPVQKLSEFLSKVKCTPGSACRDVICALSNAKAMNWKSQKKIIVLFLDGPSHGESYHDQELADISPDSDKEGENLETLCKHFADQNIALIVFKNNSETDKMLHVMEANYQFQKLADYTFPLKETLKQGLNPPLETKVSEAIGSIYLINESNRFKNFNTAKYKNGSEAIWKSTIAKRSLNFALYGGELNNLNFSSNLPSVEAIYSPNLNAEYCLEMNKIGEGLRYECYQLKDKEDKNIAKIPKIAESYMSIEDVKNEITPALFGAYFANAFNELLNNQTKIDFLVPFIFEIPPDDLKSLPKLKGNKFFTARGY